MKKILFSLCLMLAPMFIMAQNAAQFGYINTYDVLTNMSEISQIEKDMADFNKKNQDYLQTMQTEAQAKYEAYQKERDSLSESIRKIREEELQTMSDRIQTAYQSFQEDAQKEQAKKLEPVRARLQAAIDEVAKEKNLLFVFDLSTGAVAYKSDKAIDITDAVNKKLSILKK